MSATLNKTRKLEVLIIEDDPWYVDSLRRILGTDMNVQVILNPEDIFDVLTSRRPDVILADVILGAKNLMTLLNELQSYIETRNVPIVVLSTAAGQMNLADVEQFGVRKILDKANVTPAKIRATLREIGGKDV